MKYVYLFKEGNKNMRDILGGKGANLAEMTNMNLPVPNGFTISTDACKNYYKENGKISKTIKEEILKKVDELEKIVGKKFGDINNPLLVSVRSGSPISMPGMMDTILNLGLNDEVAETLIRITNNKRFVYDSYRRLIMMYANVVKGYETKAFEEILTKYKKEKNRLYQLTDMFTLFHLRFVQRSNGQDTKYWTNSLRHNEVEILEIHYLTLCQYHMN